MFVHLNILARLKGGFVIFADKLDKAFNILSYGNTIEKEGYYKSRIDNNDVYYKVNKIIGKGSFGIVYGGFNCNNQQIAIKTKKISKESDTYNKMTNILFKEEYECLIRMNHQNVVKCLGIEHDGYDIIGLVMEQVKGESLSRLIKKYSNIDEIMIQIYIKQILDGIAYIHSKNITHRDIKSSNIIIINYTFVKIIDFGMAKRVQSVNQLQNDSNSTVVGTVAYMAPELMDFKNYDCRIDIWSLGVVLHEMTTGTPFLRIKDTNLNLSQYPYPLSLIKLSNIGNSFLQLCLTRDFKNRPNSVNLLNHPFIKKKIF